jgi:SOS response regulatory protein OraA/RecX
MQLELELGGGEHCTFMLDAATADTLKIADGKLLTDEEYNTLERTHQALEWIGRLQRFLAYRMRSSGEVRMRLRRLGASNEIIDTVINILTAHSRLDDEGFAHAFVRDCLRFRSLSAQAIRQKLLAKGVPAEIADRAIASEYPSEVDLERARALAQKALRRSSSAPFQHRYRRIRDRLLRQGFSPAMVRRVLDELFDSAEPQ